MYHSLGLSFTCESTANEWSENIFSDRRWSSWPSRGGLDLSHCKSIIRIERRFFALFEACKRRNWSFGNTKKHFIVKQSSSFELLITANNLKHTRLLIIAGCFGQDELARSRMNEAKKVKSNYLMFFLPRPATQKFIDLCVFVVLGEAEKKARRRSNYRFNNFSGLQTLENGTRKRTFAILHGRRGLVTVLECNNERKKRKQADEMKSDCSCQSFVSFVMEKNVVWKLSAN